jgi:peptide/nickel transport system substrate-binding protein
MADTAGAPPNYIFPLMSGAQESTANYGLFQKLMWRPLVWTGSNGNPNVDSELSLANPPKWSSNGLTATLTLKHYLWSDGQPVTTRDVEFWMNLVIANKASFWGYTPGAFPDNIASMTYPTSYTFTITFNRRYNPTWLENEFTLITPLPQQSWDKTSSTGPVGDYDTTPAGAVAVFNYLTDQAMTLNTYSSNPLWQVVDGPWHLHAYSATTGYAELVPNAHYSGTDKPKIAALALDPFTSNAAEYNALLSGSLDYGYIPPEDYNQISKIKALGFDVNSWVGWGITYAPINMTAPVTGPMFQQLYIRQAMQHLVDQPLILSKVLKGYGTPTYGPVPLAPSTQWVSPSEKDNPYPFSVKDAKSILAAHGWSVVSTGTDTCIKPGTGAGECGANIAKGARLAFLMQYLSGSAAAQQEIEALQTWFGEAGITLNLRSEPINQLLSIEAPCTASNPSGCTWNMQYYGSGAFFLNQVTPDSSDIFATGVSGNTWGYSNATTDSLIRRTEVGSSETTALFNYEKWLAHDIPALWLPQPTFQVSAIKKTLHGATPQDREINIYPSSWTVS